MIFRSTSFIEKLKTCSVFKPIDLYLTSTIKALFPDTSDLGLLSCAMVSYCLRQGHTCMYLNQIPEDLVSGLEKIEIPSYKQWREQLQAEPAVGSGKEFLPLILDDNQLYLQKYWHYEQCFAQRIQHLLSNSNLTIISGGPGTGKTTTIRNTIQSIHEQNPDCQISVVAPTGKAVARLNEILPIKAQTIHRLLGSYSILGKFKYHSQNLLSIDVLIVDESSMVDLALMTQLLTALKQSAKVILLGDKYQLSSVEAGSFFRDLCDLNLSRSVIELKTNWRFKEDCGIESLSQWVKHADAWDIKTVKPLCDQYPDTHLTIVETLVDFKTTLTQQSIQLYQPLLNCTAFENVFKIICPTRKGPYGTIAVNQLIETALIQNGLVSKYKFKNTVFHSYQPIMITQNDYALQLYNGDTGLLLTEPSSSTPTVYFDPTRHFSLSTLTHFESAHAITAHKSQGSEFEHIIIVLGPEETPLFSRELIYTAITRARKTVSLICFPQSFPFKNTDRMSGISNQIRYNQYRHA